MAKTRNRLKRNSIMNFALVAVLTIIGILLSVCSFTIPFTHTHFEGFANSISLGLDLAGGISVVYDCEQLPGSTVELDRAIDATVTRLSGVIGSKYSEAVITRQGGSKIRIEVPSETDSDKIFDLIGEPTPLYMTDTNQNVSEASAKLVGTDIEDVFASYQQTEENNKYEYGVTLRFTKEGAKKFADLTGSVSSEGSSEGTIYIYIGDISDTATPLRLTCKSRITGGSTFISGSFENLEQAQDYALQIMSGTFNVKLNLEEQSIISATLGTNALKYCLIGGLVGLILIMAILWWRYGDFGLLASFALVIYIILIVFFLQAISFVQLTLPGLAGIVLSIGMAVDGTVIIFERVREEYRSGKKIPLSVKTGFKRAFWPIFDSNITTIFTAIVLYILGTASIQGFAITLFIGIVLSMFMNLVIMRFFVKWYLPFNMTNGKKCHLPKQVKMFKEPEVEVVGASRGGQTDEI